jgi:hypothetical protein
VIGGGDHVSPAAGHMARRERRTSAVARNTGWPAPVGAGLFDRAARDGWSRSSFWTLSFHALAVLEIFLTLRWLLGDRSPTIRAGDCVRGSESRRDRGVQVRAVQGRPSTKRCQAAGAGDCVQPVAGVTLAVVRKVRNLVWTGVGWRLSPPILLALSQGRIRRENTPGASDLSASARDPLRRESSTAWRRRRSLRGVGRRGHQLVEDVFDVGVAIARAIRASPDSIYACTLRG